MRLVASCSCHDWIVVAGWRLRVCGRCREEVVVRGLAGDDEVTVCKHEGPCS